MGLRKIPDVSTISRTMSGMNLQGFENVRDSSRSLVIEELQHERFPRLTLDFDGSVQSTKGHIEGTAVGFSLNLLIIIMTIKSLSRTKVNQRKALFCSTKDADIKSNFERREKRYMS